MYPRGIRNTLLGSEYNSLCVKTNGGNAARQIATSWFFAVPGPAPTQIQATLLTASSDTFTSLTPTSFATASISPAANSYLLAATHVAGTAIANPTPTGLGLTWTLIEVQSVIGTTQKLAVYGAQCGVSPGSGAITFTPGTILTGAAWSVTQIIGHDTTTPIAQEATPVTGGGPGLTITLPTPINTRNRWFVFIGDDNNTNDTIIAPTNWAELSENSLSTPSAKLWAGWNSGTSPTNVTITEDSTYTMRGLGVEIAVAPASTPISGSDTSSITITESNSMSVLAATTDTASLTIAEANTIAVAMSTTDTSSVTIAEANALANSFGTNDTAALSISENTATSNLLSGADAASVTISEAVSEDVALSRTDTSSLSIAESVTLSALLSRTDTAAMTITESILHSILLSASDASALVITEPSGVSTVAFKNATSSGTSDAIGSNITIAVPSGAAIGDIAIIAVAHWWNTGTINPAFTWPSGFTEKVNIDILGASGQQRMKIAWKRLTAADSGNYVTSWGTSQWRAGHCLLFSGAKTTGDPFEDFDTDTALGATTVPSLSLSIANPGSIVNIIVNEGSRTHVVPTGFTQAQNTTVLNTSYKNSVAAGATTVSGASLSASDTIITAALALQPDAGSGGTIVNVSLPAADTTGLNISETVAQDVSLSRTDTASLTISESITLNGLVSTTDLASLSISDISQVSNILSTTDTSSLSIADLALLALAVQGTDNASVTIAESISQDVSLSRTDTASVSISESVDTIVILSRSDTGAVTISDSSGIISSFTTNDTSAISISDLAQQAVALSSSDTSGLSITETSNPVVLLSRTDSGALSISEAISIDALIAAIDIGSINIEESIDQQVSFSTTDTSAITITELTSFGGSEKTLRIYVAGSWVTGILKIYINGEWKTITINIREGSTWL